MDGRSPRTRSGSPHRLIEFGYSVQSASVSYGGIREIQKDVPNSRLVARSGNMRAHYFPVANLCPSGSYRPLPEIPEKWTDPGPVFTQIRKKTDVFTSKNNSCPLCRIHAIQHP